MSIPRSTEVVDILVARLQLISPANGYHTEVTHVEDSRHQINLREHEALPILHVRNTLNNVEQVVAEGFRREARTLQIDAYLAAGEGARQRQDALLDDLYRALYTGEKILLDRRAVEIETGEAALDDAELGSRIVPIYLPVIITYTSRR